MQTNLLTIAESWSGLLEGLVGFFQNFQFIHGAEIVVFFALLYFVSKILRDNDATNLMLLYWLLLLVGGALCVFDQQLMTKGFYLLCVMLLSGFMLILFNVEVKKSLWDRTARDLPMKKEQGGNMDIRSDAEIDRIISEIIKALQNMSKNNVGALLVLSKGSLPKQVLQSGVTIDAEISTQMIEGIFFPTAPLHDGAMVIHGHKIQAAGCFLPLTQKTSYPKEYGTRHRAGIGITEVANVISLVVSEETGIISIIKQGNVTRYADFDMLTDALKDYYWQEMPLSEKKTRLGR